MGFFKRLWGYIKALFRSKAESMMDPEIEIEQAVQEAQRRDQELRNQAAQVVAHRVQLESQIERAAADAGEAKELAKQALIKAQEATSAGDAAAAEKWNRSAQALAMRLQAAENNLNSLKAQYETAVTQAEDAKKAVQQNAMRLQELAAKRMEMLGSLQQAKMQESVNKAMESLTATVGDESVSLSKVEDKIEARRAQAMAHAELREATPEGAEAELRESISVAQADAKLDELRKELGIGGPSAAPAPEAPAAPETPPTSGA
jgi:phage shock protein A